MKESTFASDRINDMAEAIFLHGVCLIVGPDTWPSGVLRILWMGFVVAAAALLAVPIKTSTVSCHDLTNDKLKPYLRIAKPRLTEVRTPEHPKK